MASVDDVKKYLAYWFQLGKPVVFQSSKLQCLPQPIFRGNVFSPEFEECWQQVINNPDDAHLSGTDETIAALLTDKWDVVDCARCDMPLPMSVRGIDLALCPCNDLPSWPNTDVPPPRSGVDTPDRLATIQQRLRDREDDGINASR